MATIGRALAEKFIAFNKDCLSPYHAVNQLETIFQEQKFNKLREDESWKLESGKTYYIVRGGLSSIMAFHVPKNYQPATSALKIFGTHCDSPCIRLAPKFATQAAGFEQAFVQLYGGGLWHTWLDRDLVLGGRIIVNEDGKLRTRLYTSKKPVAKVSTLAIHLQKDRSKLEINKETDLRPIISSLIQNEVIGDKKPSPLQETIASDLNVSWDNVVNFDLCFADANPSSFFGLNDEFISAPRIDNLYSVFASVEAFLELTQKGSDSADISILSVFDHEEIGSQTYVGADSNFGPAVYKRIVTALTPDAPSDIFETIIARSLLVSADMAHALHPNFQGNHQQNHRPIMNKGPVLKVNCNGRYTTDGVSGAVIKSVAKRHDVPLQEFIVHNESPCGSTIGPLLASKLGCLAVDIGAPQLGMHSIRETAGVHDMDHYKRLFLGFMHSNMRDLLPQ